MQGSSPSLWTYKMATLREILVSNLTNKIACSSLTKQFNYKLEFSVNYASQFFFFVFLCCSLFKEHIIKIVPHDYPKTFHFTSTFICNTVQKHPLQGIQNGFILDILVSFSKGRIFFMIYFSRCST